MKQWIDPVKNALAHPDTMQTAGDFAEFTEIMRAVINKKEEKQPTPTSAFPGPA